MHPHAFLKSLCPQLSLTSILTLISCHPAQFSSLYPLFSCHFFFKSFLSFLTPFTSPRLMSFPSAVIHLSCSFHILFPHLLSSSAPSALSPVLQTATPPWYVSNYQLLTHSSLVCLRPASLASTPAPNKPPNSSLPRSRQKGSHPHALSSLSSVQRWRPAHSPATWAGAAAEPALYSHAEQHAAPLLPPHDPDVRLRLLHQRRHAGGPAYEAAQLSGAAYRRRAPSWHLSDFLQWAHTQRHRRLVSGRWEPHIFLFIILGKFSALPVKWPLIHLISVDVSGMQSWKKHENDQCVPDSFHLTATPPHAYHSRHSKRQAVLFL